MAVSTTLFVVMWIAWRTQKTYPGFGRWTASKIPHALGWLLVSLRGSIPDWASVLLANGLLFLSPLLLFEGILQFRSRPHRDVLNYVLMGSLLGASGFFLWVQPSVNARVVAIVACTALVIGRSAAALSRGVPRELRSSFWFTASLFGLYDLILLLRVVTALSLPALSDPFVADSWQNVLILSTVVMPIGWTFGFFMMTNARLTLELRKAEGELREMAATDFLTGTLNRRAFLELSQREHKRAQRSGQSMVLLLFDIDRFKEFNDRHGHLGGDTMLKGIVATSRFSLRAEDLLVRWGGDEFVVLLPGTDQAGGAHVAEKLRRAVAETSVPVEAEQASVTISVGGALWTPDEEREAVLERADSALYEAKQRGRNCVVGP